MSRERGGAKLSVGMYTTVGERCGIADYTRALTDALAPTADVATIPLWPGALNPVAIVRAGVRLSRKDVAHVQHTYSFFGVDQLTYTLLVRLLRASVRAPLVLTAHTVRQLGPSRLEGGLGSALANAVGAPAWHDVETFRRAEMVVVHARLHRDRLLARGVAPERCRVIPPGVPPRAPVAAAERVAFRARRGLGERPVVGVFGFLERSKRFSVVLEALGTLGGGRGDGPVLVLAGGPRLPEHEPVVAEIKGLAAQAGLADRVVVTGYLGRGEVPVALEAMDVVVVPYATDDSVSYSLHLALAQGRPVVATDLDPLREIQERGGCLLLVRRDDARDLANALGTLLGDEGAKRRLMAAAAAYARAESVAVAARRTLDAYEAARETRHG